MAYQQLAIENFSGGITDYLFDAPLNQYAMADNFILTPNAKLKTRNGSALFDSNHFSVLASGNPRINTLMNFNKDTYLFAHIGLNLYYTTGTWGALLGPVDSNVVFDKGTSTSLISYTEWNKHMFLVDDQFSIPMKIFQDQNGTLQVRNAGLQLIELTSAINLANQIKTKFNDHIADAVGEHILADTVNNTTSPTCYDLQTLLTLVSELLTDYAAHRLDATIVTPIYHVATSAGNALASVSAPRTLTECQARLDDLKTKVNAHDNDATAHGATGNYQVSYVRSIAGTGTAGAQNFLYRLHYVYNYQVGTVIFSDFGPTSDDVSVLSVNAPNVNSITLANIPVLANGHNTSSGNNYDTVNITIQIYRTVNNGTVYLKVGEITNGTTSFVDSTSDSTLGNSTLLYTTGGVVDNDQPPPCKYIHVVNGFAYYGHIKEGSQVLNNRVVQSIQSDLDSVPSDFFVDLEEEVTGLSSVNDKPIFFTTKWAYRIEGFFDELGRGGMSAQKINNATGCVSAQSMVQTNFGLFYAGSDGFYFTDGYTVQKISTPWSDTYKNITNSSTKISRIVGTYEQQNQRIYWTIKYSDSSADNDRLLVLDLRFGVKADSCFTTWSGGDGFSPTSIVFFNKELIRSDRRGYLFKHQDALASDLKLNTSVTPTSWVKQTIMWNYFSVSTNFGSSQVRKFVNRIIFKANDESNASILITSYNDENRAIADLKEIRWRRNLTWGDPEPVWGDPVYVWGSAQMIEEMRRFPAGGLRCSYKQISITNSFTNISKSDVLGLASIDAALKTVTLLNASFSWSLVVEDYYISFLADNYTKQYLITSRTSDTVLTYQDPQNTTITSASSKWQIKGYVKDEKLHIIKYVYQFYPMSDSVLQYGGTSYAGGNA